MILMFIVLTTTLVLSTFNDRIVGADSTLTVVPNSFGMRDMTGNFISPKEGLIVAGNSKVVIRLSDQSGQGFANFTEFDFIVVKENGINISGKTVVSDSTDGKEKELIFTPIRDKGNVWEKGKTYVAALNGPLNIDPSTPSTFQFTIEPMESNPNSSLGTNPHSFMLSADNNNTCFTCHGTQKTLDLMNGKTVGDAATDFCLACHDGTVAKYIVGSDEKFRHGKEVEGQSRMTTSQCSDCHDVHLNNSDGNVLLLKSTTEYVHQNPIDTSNKTCYTCHRDETGQKQSEAEKNGLKLKPYKYLKYSDEPRKKEDMSLCFSCHNANGTAPDIEKFFTVESGHNILFDSNASTEQEGYLSCSDCHETHGSKNIYILKSSLGNQSTVSYSASEKFETGNVQKDRQAQIDFCMGCHNGASVIYGRSPKLLNKDTNGHGDNYGGTCASCHGGASKTFMEVAHSPIRKTNTGN